MEKMGAGPGNSKKGGPTKKIYLHIKVIVIDFNKFENADFDFDDKN